MEDRVRANLEAVGGGLGNSGAPIIGAQESPHRPNNQEPNNSQIIEDINDREPFGATANSDLEAALAQSMGGPSRTGLLEPVVEESPLRSLVSEIENRYR